MRHAHDTLGKHRKVAGQVPGEVPGQFRKVLGAPLRFLGFREVSAQVPEGSGQVWKFRQVPAQVPEGCESGSGRFAGGKAPGTLARQWHLMRSFRNPPGTFRNIYTETFWNSPGTSQNPAWNLLLQTRPEPEPTQNRNLSRNLPEPPGTCDGASTKTCWNPPGTFTGTLWNTPGTGTSRNLPEPTHSSKPARNRNPPRTGTSPRILPERSGTRTEPLPEPSGTHAEAEPSGTCPEPAANSFTSFCTFSLLCLWMSHASIPRTWQQRFTMMFLRLWGSWMTGLFECSWSPLFGLQLSPLAPGLYILLESCRAAPGPGRSVTPVERESFSRMTHALCALLYDSWSVLDHRFLSESEILH